MDQKLQYQENDTDQKRITATFSSKDLAFCSNTM
ncbi:hypothetical protein COLO4_33040 [Corchorus olitorius]|uniref:Uncharacterized protein n=1 Tax=Corchorus olitorius TaxID=93759 RepID=A0A1R3GWM6_9ROSI|nr:hypothetical protein COLO4_33040 [Corchorus olitorius]